MLVNGSTGARSSAMMVVEWRRMNTYTETARMAMARAFQLCAWSARIPTIPPAPTPATKPVTASPARAETGADEDREDQGRIAVPLPVFARDRQRLHQDRHASQRQGG